MPAGTSPTQSSPSGRERRPTELDPGARRSARASHGRLEGRGRGPGSRCARRARGAARRRRAGRWRPSRTASGPGRRCAPRATPARARTPTAPPATVERVARRAAARHPSPADAAGDLAERRERHRLGRVGRLEVGHDAVEHQRVVGRVLAGEPPVAGAALAQVLAAGRRCSASPPSRRPRRRKPSMNSSSSTPSLPPKREYTFIVLMPAAAAMRRTGEGRRALGRRAGRGPRRAAPARVSSRRRRLGRAAQAVGWPCAPLTVPNRAVPVSCGHAITIVITM